ncbi:hypothetical protein A5761_10085 [Mycolicibacterium setense]|uniref:FAD-dependent oxidoreductase n=1 Tax=Mycolicibacterium setense TaxID=431269 RepID=UPI0007EC0D36|nr:FAD-dependent oxidoreductase [Mycolicibacterium setense]OBB17692.1 hypothetical protein A5761_10085 [Mycolicibacterium setense]
MSSNPLPRPPSWGRAPRAWPATTAAAAERGHKVTRFEATDRIGGQFNIAKTIPGKEELHETLRYFGHRLADTGVNLCLNTPVTALDLRDGGFDEVILATGVHPRVPDIPGIDHPSVVGYLAVLRDEMSVGSRVAILGAGGIGFDVAKKLTATRHNRDEVEPFLRWRNG